MIVGGLFLFFVNILLYCSMCFLFPAPVFGMVCFCFALFFILFTFVYFPT